MLKGFSTKPGQSTGTARAFFPAVRDGSGGIRISRLGGLQNSPSQFAAARHAVDPADAVARRFPRLRQTGHEGVQIRHPPLPHHHGRRRHGPQPEADVQDHAGQADAADGGGEQLRPLGRRNTYQFARRQDQVEPQDMVAEAPGAVMVLAVDIVGDSASDGRESGARRGRRQEAAARECVQQIVEGDARFADQRPVRRVEETMRFSRSVSSTLPPPFSGASP